MASSPTSFDPLLVSVKAVDPAKYPFYGKVELMPALAPGNHLPKCSRPRPSRSQTTC